MTDSVVTRPLAPQPTGFTPEEYKALVESELLRLVREDRDRREAELAEARALGRRNLEAQTSRGDRLMKRLHAARELVIRLRHRLKEVELFGRPKGRRRGRSGSWQELREADEFLASFTWD